ncbi:PREDICTED: uncharacterized protein LOC105455056 [Wasmannia auropunctata]|uniref:uncharacterized protein LOC105455056 n=1 Tax=Wasmannia auropunctata TaxID=64793 RepID=UPI0005F09F34|nr:PREDICTED: uncharacterized protein LOC105455056 [Wasmannia auropunctata]
MAEQRRSEQRNWLLEHSVLVQHHGDTRYLCNTQSVGPCSKLYNSKEMEVHLYRVHEISGDDSDIRRSSLIWRYFNKTDKQYSMKCRKCKDFWVSCNRGVQNLRRHVMDCHWDDVRVYQAELTRTWLSRHLKLDELTMKVKCVYGGCSYKCCMYRMDKIIGHLFRRHNVTEGIAENVLSTEHKDSFRREFMRIMDQDINDWLSVINKRLKSHEQQLFNLTKKISTFQ